MKYVIESSHTCPSFEPDYLSGLSEWRGKINSSLGHIVLDKTALTGIVAVDFGHERLNEHVRDGEMLDI